MIRRINIKDFKAHRDTTVDLGRFTMLVGDNASGKTSVLDALWLQAALHPNPVQVLKENWAPEDLLRRGGDGPTTLTSEGDQGGSAWRTAIKLQIKTSAGKPDREWKLELEGNRGQIGLSARASGASGGSAGWENIPATIGKAALYRLRADRIAAAAYSSDTETAVEPDGTNTAVVLAALKLGNDEAFDQIERSLQKLIPSVERIRIRPATVQDSSVGGRAVVGSKLYFDFRGAPGVPAHNASHGTLIVLALLSVIHGQRRPNLILLDDFDHALHPRAQMELVRLIKGLLALDEFKDLQVVATTHSPYTLDELDPADVQAFALRDDGTVASKRLSLHPEFKRMQGTLGAGQLWSLDPEREWVLGNQAA